MAEPFYKVVFEGAWVEANPLRLSTPDLLDLKVGDTIPVVLSFERIESDPRPRVREIIASIDDFATLDLDHKKAAIENLRRYRPSLAVGEIVRIETDPESRDCLGLLVVREIAPS